MKVEALCFIQPSYPSWELTSHNLWKSAFKATLCAHTFQTKASISHIWLLQVLGQSTADILTEAETEASKFATKLQGLDANLETEPHNIMTCEICQLFVRTVDRLLDKRDRLMNHYLPLTEEEICNLKIAVGELDDEVVDCQRESCLARINNLSGKLRQRAYMMTLSQLRVARRNTQESLCQLHQTIDLVGLTLHFLPPVLPDPTHTPQKIQFHLAGSLSIGRLCC
uniref:Uncharacterized protein n=1 Tax=Anolis carolinensis TaxID=28377 RepID=A0A803TWX6_ANOCA